MLLAIDPGNQYSGWVLLNDKYEPIKFGKDTNEDVLDSFSCAWIHWDERYPDEDSYDVAPEKLVIEMVASYGMAVGQTVFDTCVWIGRFQERFDGPVEFMYRKDVKMNLCGQTKAKDSNIRQALVDRFSYDRHKAKGGKGTKADPGFFNGFKADVWQAMALGVTYLDMEADDGNM
jgi:hypothetical protein